MSDLPNLLSLITSVTWAIRPEMLSAIISVAERDEVNRHVLAAAAHWSEDRQREAARAYETKIPLRAVGSYQSEPVRDSFNLYRRGSIAVLPVTGTITRYSNLFQAMSGSGASVETMAKDLRTALDDPSFSSVLLSVDSPGGEANGIEEFSRMVFDGRAEKPIWAYVSDLGASAAYWIASAADVVAVAPTAALGSIGCIAVFREPSKKEVSFVSSVSPQKKMDPQTKDGARGIQALVDKMGRIFVDSVADYRDVTPDQVEEDFGRGGLLVGDDAVEAGMADMVSSFEGCIIQLQEREAPRRAPRLASSVRAYTLGCSSIPSVEITYGDHSSPAAVELARIEAAVQEPTEERSMPDEKVPATTTTPPGPDPVQAKLAALEAENARLRLQNHRIAASAYADKMIAEQRAFPAEKVAIEALYIQSALDDENLGPGLDGHVRLALLGVLMGSRPSVSFLTAEALGTTTMQAITQKVAAASVDPDAPMTEEKRLRLLDSSPLGKQAMQAAK